MIVSDDDRVSVMASDEFEEAEEEAQPQQDYASRVFNPEPIDKDKWEPHEAIVNYVNRHYSKMFSNTVKSVIIRRKLGFQTLIILLSQKSTHKF